MILETIQLPELKNVERSQSGIDSTEHVPPYRFSNYPNNINYKFNSRGFRDYEWPDHSLDNVIWCIGDSFTLGLGCPFDHTWPQILQKRTGQRVINVSMDGASNQWISRKAIDIIEEVNPKNLIVMWSFTHRREIYNLNLSDMERRIWADDNSTEIEDFIYFRKTMNSVIKKCNNNLIHLVVPKAYKKRKNLIYEFNDVKNFIGEVKVLDYGRDAYHFDIKTSELVCDKIIPLLTT